MDYKITIDSVVDPNKCEIRLLDNYHNLSLVEDAIFDGNTIIFSSQSYSACALIKIKP
jgi:hypothetical protein